MLTDAPNTTEALTPEQSVLARLVAEEMAVGGGCAPDDQPPCCEDCACWKGAVADALCDEM